MGTPCWFRFPVVPERIEQVFGRTAALRELHGFRPRDMGRLAWDEDTGRFEFQDESIRGVRKDGEVLEVARGWDGFAVAYNVLSTRATI